MLGPDQLPLLLIRLLQPMKKRFGDIAESTRSISPRTSRPTVQPVALRT